jgi:Heterokaryon incompatibility protein (HET)
MRGNLELPTRVLDVGYSRADDGLRLLTSKGTRGQWVTLSHCWGGKTPLKTTTKTLPTFELGIKLHQLPLSFQDAVTITRRLGYRYLWIYSLCIIQDSQADWASESGRMAYVYSNSVLTIAATAASDSSKGIFRSANSGRKSHLFKFSDSCKGSQLGCIWIRKGATAPNSEEPHLDKRGWMFQEELLAPRYLRYDSSKLYWSCRTSDLDEDNSSDSYTVSYDRITSQIRR